MADQDNFTPIDLDTSLDDIEDLPSFGVFPTGAYRVACDDGFEEQKINDFKALTLSMRCLETMDVADDALEEGEAPPKVGDTATLMWNLENKFGAGTLKQFMAPIAEKFGAKKLRGVVENSRGLELFVVLTRVHGKKGTPNEGKTFQRVKKVAVI